MDVHPAIQLPVPAGSGLLAFCRARLAGEGWHLVRGGKKTAQRIGGGDAVHTGTLTLYPLRHVLHTSAARRVL